jgi:hypothetical protein
MLNKLVFMDLLRSQESQKFEIACEIKFPEDA